MNLYLAYGSNLNVSQMANRCPGAEPVGRVALPDHRLVFRGSRFGCYLSVDPSPGDSVECVAWSLKGDNESALDFYEGYPHFYGKFYALLSVRSLEGGRDLGEHQCMWYALPVDRPLGLPSRAYVRTCAIGYQDFGLPVETIKQAIRRSASHAAAEVAISRGFPAKDAE